MCADSANILRWDPPDQVDGVIITSFTVGVEEDTLVDEGWLWLIGGSRLMWARELNIKRRRGPTIFTCDVDSLFTKLNDLQHVSHLKGFSSE